MTVNGRIARSTRQRVDPARDKIAVDHAQIVAETKHYLMLNKPRGLVTTRHDPLERGTVYDCLSTHLPFLSPVGRLDKASEGLLLLTNDTRWAEYLLNPVSGVPKTYHVKIDKIADDNLMSALSMPIEDRGERLNASAARLLRHGVRSSWIEVELTEGRNRQVRRMIAAAGANVLRLVRVRIGTLTLGDLGKGQSRPLTRSEQSDIWRTDEQNSGHTIP